MKFTISSISIFKKIANCGVTKEDSQEVIVKKQMITMLPLLISAIAIVWSVIYLLLGFFIAASISLFYVIFSIFGLYRLSKSKNIHFLKNSQLTLLLLLPFALMWLTGGFVLGSYVMIWAFFCPLTSISFSPKKALMWFFFFTILIVISALIDDFWVTNITPLPSSAITIFTVINILAGFGGIFMLVRHYVGLRDFSEIKCNKLNNLLSEKTEELELLANYDDLTKVYNRRSMNNMMTLEMSRLKRYKHPLSILLMDVDNFKSINDAYGHQKGDEVLKEISSEISKLIRKTDHFGRWGGEEFVLVMPHTKIEDALLMANKLCNFLADYKYNFIDKVTCSFGVVACDKDIEINESLHFADLALYKAKKLGKNQVIAWENNTG